jgi:transposase-like protein
VGLANLEAQVWPNGSVCSRCGACGRIKKLAEKTAGIDLHKCYNCIKLFTAKIGAVFESSHVPLHLWLQGVHLICGSKNGIGSNQLRRAVGVTLKTAWFMSHRLQEAMKEPGWP